MVRVRGVAVGLMIWAAAACGDETPEYTGVSDTLPTGSTGIGADGLVAAYDFATFVSDGRLRDFSGNDNHGEALRSLVTAGLFGQARVFDSVLDRVHLRENETLDLNGPLSIAVWVRVDSLDIHQHILACDDKFALWITPANQFRLGDTRGGGYSTAEGSVQTGTWYSVVAVLGATQGDTLQEGDVELYVNGSPADASVVLRAQATERPAATWGSAELYPEDACYLGFESHQGNEAHQQLPFKGALDEALLFSRPLSHEEVRSHAKRPET